MRSAEKVLETELNGTSTSEELTETFKKVYSQVFNEDNTVKSCGRAKCIELIALGNKLIDVPCGNEVSGVMNIDALVSLRNCIK